VLGAQLNGDKVNNRILANAIRFLSIDAVNKANSGHPGAPMGMADIATVLWREFLKHNPKNPGWFNRDRFVLSNGHGSMLLYSLLHLSGYKLSINDIKKFRQLNSLTPGHPECDITPGVETTTGPLGQGLANGVGMALAEKNLAAEYNKPGNTIIDHNTYVFAGDGCLMEGVSHEACSLAGTMKLNKLIVFYDMNSISIDGNVNGWFTEDIPSRFKSYGWNVVKNINGHDFVSIRQAIKNAKSQFTKPTIICCKTVIGYGSPKYQGTSAAHGAPIGKDEAEVVRKRLGWKHKPFSIPKEIYTSWDGCIKGRKNEDQWNKKIQKYKKLYKKEYNELNRRIKNKLPAITINNLNKFISKTHKPMATRKSSQVVMSVFGKYMPELIGGSADLKGSNLSYYDDMNAFSPNNPSGKYIYYGVREFGMSAITNGIYLHGAMRPFASTFLIFSEYAKNAVRMSALMKLPIVYIFTHDSIGLGEDGPTHQAVEQISSLRLIPDLDVWRPADTQETAVAWKHALLSQERPSALALTRQTLKELPKSKAQNININKGGYIVFESSNKPDGIIIASGSEVSIALQAAMELKDKNLDIRVISMPCQELYERQSATYKNKCIPKNFDNILAVESGKGQSWFRYIGKKGSMITMESFGLSGTGNDVMRYFGFTVANIKKQMQKLIKKNR
jgi:transketolase